MLLIECLLLLSLFSGDLVLGPCFLNMQYLMSLLVLQSSRWLGKISVCFTFINWLSSCCHVAFSILCLFLMVPWVGLQFSSMTRCISRREAKY